ncbi:MAG: PstS family phosphate ABC transporter substrate-binding protein [Oscillospiraceae bacterium]
MDKKLLAKQIAILSSIVLGFAIIDCGIYFGFTRKYTSTDTSKLMQEKSIDLDKYLPFDDNSLIVDYKSSLQLTGDLPILDGATALFPVYSAFMNSTYPQDSCEFINDDFTSNSKLQKTGTTGAYNSIVDGSADIIFVAQPSTSQKEYALQNHVELEYIPIGFEAFVFIVNSNNSIDNLSSEQIRGIYSGEYSNWKELGGEDINIIPLQRNENSGSQTAMLSFMGDTEISVPMLNNKVIGKSIGYSFRYYVEDVVSNHNVKTIAVDGIKPTIENIQNGTYPIVDNFYAVYRKDNTNENVKILIDWILSEEGQKIISDTGYVSISN